MVTFCEAIARQEGWLVPSSRCRRNHNPGNIEYGGWAVAHGAIASDGRFAIFPDDATGFAAMSALLMTDYVGLSVQDAVAKWAPPTENDTAEYVCNVCTWTQLTPETSLTSSLLLPPLINT